MMKKNIFETLNYEQEYNKAEDYILWIKATENYKLSNIPHVLYKYRLHRNQTEHKSQQESANRARKVMLKKIACHLNKVEFNIFVKIALYQYIPISEFELVINKILTANKISKYLDQNELKKVIAMRYWAIVNQNSYQGLDVFYKFHFSPYKRLLCVSRLNYIHFFIKCLIHYPNKK